MSKHDYIVLLHGIFRTSRHMRKLATYLENGGYEVLNLDYPSRKYPLAQLASQLQHTLETRLTKNKIVHFVGYSMGGLLIRVLLNQYRPNKLGRVVQIAPSNHGSEISDFLQHNQCYRKLYGPAGQQLTTDEIGFRYLVGAVDFDLGVIAGILPNAWFYPLSSLMMTKPHDGRVSVRSTQLEGMKDHL